MKNYLGRMVSDRCQSRQLSDYSHLDENVVTDAQDSETNFVIKTLSASQFRGILVRAISLLAICCSCLAAVSSEQHLLQRAQRAVEQDPTDPTGNW